MSAGKKVLSIQSHVVHGYVGNKAATFPLQCKGWDVDALNTVQFSNHPAYGFSSGFKSRSEDLEQIIWEGLVSGLDIRYDAVLTGYLPDPEGLKKIGEVLGKVCDADLRLQWVLDPVLGDEGKLYVPKETVDIYKQILREQRISLATPNQFELEILSGCQITDIVTLKQAMRSFHAKYPRVQRLVVTSLRWGLENGSFVSTCTDFKDYWYFEVPRIEAHFFGSGDLFSAIIMDLLVSESQELPLALNNALSLVDDVLRRTYALARESASDPETPLKINDLKIVQSKDLFRQPPQPKFTAQKL